MKTLMVLSVAAIAISFSNVARAFETLTLSFTDFERHTITSVHAGEKIIVEAHLLSPLNEDTTCNVDYGISFFKIIDEQGTFVDQVGAGLCHTNLGGLHVLSLNIIRPGTYTIEPVFRFKRGIFAVANAKIVVE